MIDVEGYNEFMGKSVFPGFETEYVELDLKQPYAHVAQAEYDWKKGTHLLRLPSNAEIPKFLLYHELTHIYDMEYLKTGNKNHDYCLNGYMEYHASQVEFMVLMGASHVYEKISFTMKDPIHHMDCSVKQYLENKLESACNLVKSENAKRRIDGLGVFYNFLGLKSICNMYAVDFEENFTYRNLAERLSAYLMFEIRKCMVGWIADPEYAVNLYSNALICMK